MKTGLTLLLILLLFGASNANVNIDSVLTSSSTVESTDTVNISQLVEMQILAARLKAIEEKDKVDGEILSVQEINKNEPVDQKYEEYESTTVSLGMFNGIILLINGIPVEYKILITFSVILLIAILFRRITMKMRKKIKAELKKKISMMREEKVLVRPDGKKSDLRKTLVENAALNQLSEKNIGKTAKELRLSKGELLLAARIKYLEYSKM